MRDKFKYQNGRINLMLSLFSSSNFQRGAGNLFALVGVGFASAYAYRAFKAQKEVKAASGCGCGPKKVVKNAPPADSQVILKGGCRTCHPQAAVYNPLYINPIFDPSGYQTQDLTNFAQVEEPLNYSPYRTQVQKRSILRSNLGGGI